MQDHIIFTYDDLRCAQNVVQLVPPPNRIVSIREARYKLARNYDGDDIEPDQWEMYDLGHDPGEWVNLAVSGTTLPAEQSAARAIDREAAGGRGAALAAAVVHARRSARERPTRRASRGPGVSDPNPQHPSATTGQLPPGTRMPADCGEEREGCDGCEDGKDDELDEDDEGDELPGR